MREITSGQFRTGMAGAAQAMIDAKQELGRLDAIGGDGDLGATMEAGFKAVLERLEMGAGETIGDQVRTVGDTLCTHAPSTFGTLLGIAMTVAADPLDDGESLTIDTLAPFLDTMSKTIASVGKVELGQRTVLDALEPAASAARASGKTDPRLGSALEAACRAAEVGAEATAGMRPAVGRARWTAESATGSVDAGAKAFAIWLRAFSDTLSTMVK